MNLAPQVKKTTVEKKITLLNADRVKNIEMILMKLRMPFNVLKEALFSINEEILNPNSVETLINAVPNEEEVKLVHSFTGKRETLGNPERFCIEISEVPGFSHRLHALKFYRNHKEDFEEFNTKYEKLSNLVFQLENNKKLILLLENILATGNLLNGDSKVRGGAYGFKLDTFEKTADMKSNLPKRTLLIFIIENLEKNLGNNKELIFVNEDLGDYDLASKTPINQLTLDLADFKKSLKYVQNAMKMQSDYEKDHVREFFSGFYSEINEKVMKYDEGIKKIDEEYLKICSLFNENVKNTPSDKFFEKFYKFWISCRTAKQIMIREKEIAKKEEEKKRRQEMRMHNIVANQEKNINPIFGNNNLSSMKKDKPEDIALIVKERRTTKKSINYIFFNY